MIARLAAVRMGAAFVVGLAALAAARRLRANPRPLPFTYQSETLPQGAVEVEQFVDYVPTRAIDRGTGEAVWFGASQFQTEFEVGLTDRLELAIYFAFTPEPADRYGMLPVMPNGTGWKQRVRYRLAEPQEWPIDVALYGEVAENEREIELEAKIILQRRIGRLRLIANLWAEYEIYFRGEQEWVLNPTAGATFEISPRFHLGLEGWMRAEYEDGFTGPRAFNMGPHYYVGPAFMCNFGRLWWTTGAYWRADDPGRTVEAGDVYGPFWVRSIVGIGF